MNIWIFRLTLIILTFSVQADDENSLQYSIKRSSKTTIDISLSFTSNLEREELVIPTSYAGSTGAEKGVRNITIRNEKCGIDLFYKRIDQKVIELNNCGSSTFIVQYQLVQVEKSNSEPLNNYLHLPAITDSKFQWINALALIVPWPKNSNISVQVSVDPSTDEEVYSNLPSSKENNYFFNGDVYDFILSFLYVGNAESITIEKDAGFQFLFENAVQQNALPNLVNLKSILSFLQNKLGGRNDSLSLLITGINLVDGYESTGGLALNNSIWIQTTGMNDKNEFSHLLIHELIHAWLPGKFIFNSDDDQLAMRWFTEGFTDYLAVLTAKEMKLVSQETFNNYINEVMLTVKYSSFADLKFENWKKLYNNPPVWLSVPDQLNNVPYWKGFLLALKWDEELKRKNSDVYAVINQMIAEKKHHLTFESIENSFHRNGVKDPRGDINSYILNNESALSTQLRYLSCGLVTLKPHSYFDFGFEFEIGKPVSNLKSHSNAFKAGLRNGDLVNTAVYKYGDKTEKVRMIIADGREIQYIPAASGSEHVIKPISSLPSTDNLCSEWVLN